MSPIIFQLTDSIAINWYGVCIATGLVVALVIGSFDKRAAYLYKNNILYDIVSIGIIAALAGSRLLHIITDYHQYRSFWDMLAFWDGGLSLLGALIAAPLCLGTYMYFKHIPIISTLDLVIGMYVPLLHGFGRLGCWFAGCCHGIITTSLWHVTYTHPLSLAPCNIPLIPIQLYTALASFVLFFILWGIGSYLKTPGILLCLGIAGISTIRFVTDFWRGDRDAFVFTFPFSCSFHQALSLVIIAFLCSVMTVLALHKKWRENSKNGR